jgi:glutamine amidotransferase
VIGIVDYGMGNRRSVEKALERVGAEPRLTADHAELREADGIVVPGVGAFPEAMRRLRDSGLDEVIRERAENVPVLGLCLGMQVLCEGSEEFEDTEGLGLLSGWVRPLTASGMKLPHIGWHEVSFVRETPLTAAAGEREAYYHVHSFAPERTEDAVAIGDYGGEFVSIVARERVFGCQFHPEKSSHAGLALLREFTGLCVPVPA